MSEEKKVILFYNCAWCGRNFSMESKVIEDKKLANNRSKCPFCQNYNKMLSFTRMQNV